MHSSKYLFIIVAFAFSCKTKNQNINQNAINAIADSLRSELNRIYDEGFVNGFSCALVNQDAVLLSEGFGYSNKKDEQPYTSNTIQRVASISKTLIGLSLLKAQEMGKLNIDDPISKYLPFDVRNSHFPNDPITIRQLATHTSTISDPEEYNRTFTLYKDPIELADYPLDIIEEFQSPNDSLSLSLFLEHLLSEEGTWYKPSNFLNAKPGTTFEYSNLGANLAALIVQLATGENYDYFTKQLLIEKAGMNSSGWRTSDLDRDSLSTLYLNVNQDYPEYYEISYPDGGLITSANDLANYLIELINGYNGKGSLLEVNSYKEFFGNHELDSTLINSTDERPFMDIMHDRGVFISYTSNGYIGHTGLDYGLVTAMFFNARTKMGRLLIINTDLNFGIEEELNYLWKLWNKLGEYEAKYYKSMLVTNTKNEYAN